MTERASGVTGLLWLVRFYHLTHELNCSGGLYFHPLHAERGFFTQFQPLRQTPATACFAVTVSSSSVPNPDILSG